MTDQLLREDDLDEVGLLEWARRTGEWYLEQTVLDSLGLELTDAPLDVPLHDLDWRYTVLTDTDPVPIAHTRIGRPCVGRDHSGRRFLARRGDVLIRDDRGHYALIRRS